MKLLLVVFALLISRDTALAGLNIVSSEMYKKCYGNGTCRLECYGSEMLVAYCRLRLECCVKGNPEP
ncbi:beta-defensin 134 [Molossus nigricans]